MSLPNLVLAVDHRPQLVEEANARGRTVADCQRFKELVAKAFLEAADRVPVVRTRGGLILDHELGAAGMKLARKVGVRVGQPVEIAGEYPLRLYDDYERVVLRQGAAFTKCLVNGRPDDEAAVADAQTRTVVDLSQACARTGVPLVLELIVARRGEGEEPFEGSLRADLTARWMEQLRQRGVRPAQWKLEGFANAGSARRVAAACVDAEEIVILGKGAGMDQLRAQFAAANGLDRFVGFAVGRTIFWDPFLAHLGGASADAVVGQLRDRYLEVVRLWESR